MAWDTWKGGTFQDLQTDDMGMQAQSMLKKLTKLAREVKVHMYVYELYCVSLSFCCIVLPCLVLLSISWKIKVMYVCCKHMYMSTLTCMDVCVYVILSVG